jgi:hypothetical protein
MRVGGEGEGKTALVTGASTGIGWYLAREFAAHGFELVLVARSAEKLEALAKQVADRYRVRALARPLDLLEPGAPRDLFDDLSRRGIPIEVLVNNAGVMRFGRFHEMPLESLLAVLCLNAGALTALTRLFVERMSAAEEAASSTWPRSPRSSPCRPRRSTPRPRPSSCR